MSMGVKVVGGLGTELMGIDAVGRLVVIFVVFGQDQGCGVSVLSGGETRKREDS
jgi:hypothetical protein